jgi:hypothetical protein
VALGVLRRSSTSASIARPDGSTVRRSSRRCGELHSPPLTMTARALSTRREWEH